LFKEQPMGIDANELELSDVQVDTLGLVTDGAAKETFFLLKSAEPQEGTDPEPVVPVVDEAALTKSVVTRLFEAIVGKRAPSSLATEDAAEEAVEKEVSESIPDEPEAELETETLKSDTDTGQDSEAPITGTKDVEKGVDSMSDETNVVDTRLADLEKSLKAQQDREADLLARLEKAEQDARNERELREREVYVTKASNLGNFPVPSAELGEQLHWLSKQDEAREQFWTELLKAIQNSLDDAALFVEKGNVLPEADPIEKAITSGADIKQALQSLPPQVAENYIRSMRRQIANAAR